jgi:hypothetical protein
MDAATGIVDDQAPLVRALIALTVVTGLVDAISFLGLGHVFDAQRRQSHVLQHIDLADP